MKLSLDGDKREDWNGMSFDEPSKAVIACDENGHGCVLWAVGAHILFEIDAFPRKALDDLGLDDAPAGVSVWEGKYVFHPGGFECPEDGTMDPVGTFRAPNDDEWGAIRSNTYGTPIVQKLIISLGRP